jgi:sulfur-oxidizing protein SoxX
MTAFGCRLLVVIAGLTAAHTAAAQVDGAVARGAAIVASRSQGLCVLCHAVPGQPAHLQGSIGPPLAGVGERLDAAALRERLLVPQRFNPDTVMPAYGAPPPGLQRVAAERAGRPLLQPAQIDDVVAYLASLK